MRIMITQVVMMIDDITKRETDWLHSTDARKEAETNDSWNTLLTRSAGRIESLLELRNKLLNLTR